MISSISFSIKYGKIGMIARPVFIPLFDNSSIIFNLIKLEGTFFSKNFDKFLFDYSFIQHLLNSHFDGKRVYTHQIYSLLIFELWCNEYLG